MTISSAEASSSSTLSASNSRVSLTLHAPPLPSTSFLPGDTLRPIIAFHGTSDYTSVSLSLKGVVKLGFERWQTGAARGPTAALLANPQYISTFLDLPVQLVSPTSRGAQAQAEAERGKRGNGLGAGSGGEQEEAAVDGEGMYEVVIPQSGQESLLPTRELGKHEHLVHHPVGFCVQYTLEFLGTRKGLLKSNDRLTLDIPIAIPAPNKSNSAVETWPTATVTKALKYKSDGAPPPIVTATLIHQPLSISGEPLQFHFILSGAAHLLNPSTISISAGIARKIQNYSVTGGRAEEEGAWTDVSTKGRAVVGLVDAGGLSDSPELKWTGSLQVPKSDRTVRHELGSVKYALTLHVSAPGLDGHIKISNDVFLPSSEVSIDVDDADLPGGPAPPAYDV
ncbi:hypothetical protein MNV49_001421 [Pseudohyphozyma bogoriensis]|nr:hypothetical protein MNV49_001421 [Pseudohyphozyma bogoriensis]